MNEKDSVANFLNEVTEPKDIFKEEIATEAEPEEVEEEEKALPFHKDPKVQKYIEKRIEESLKSRPSAEQGFKKDVEEINLPSSFVRLVGNDTPEKLEVLKDLSNYFGTLKGEAKKEFLDELKTQETAKTEADTKAQEELDDYFEKIEETYDVDLSSNSATAKQMRSKFIDYVRDIAPKDEQGEVAGFPDLISAFKRFQNEDKGTVRPASRAKELANRGMTRSSDTTTAVPQGRSWKDVDRYFDKLKGN